MAASAEEEEQSSDSDYEDEQRMHLVQRMKAVRSRRQGRTHGFAPDSSFTTKSQSETLFTLRENQSHHGVLFHNSTCVCRGAVPLPEQMMSEGEEHSCNSSQLSNKSEKNMADFDGEDVVSDDELSRIHAHAQSPAHPHRRHTHMQQHLANMASAYHKHENSKCASECCAIQNGKINRPNSDSILMLSHESLCSALAFYVWNYEVWKKYFSFVADKDSSQSSHGGDCDGAAHSQLEPFNFDDVCKPGNTLLWDLLQDPVAVSTERELSIFNPGRQEHEWKYRRR